MVTETNTNREALRVNIFEDSTQCSCSWGHAYYSLASLDDITRRQERGPSSRDSCEDVLDFFSQGALDDRVLY